MVAIDYIFFRLYRHYKENPIFTASIYISVLQIFVMYFILMMTNAIFYSDRLFGKEFMVEYSISPKERALYALGLFFVLQMFNYFIYRKRIETLEKRFANHPADKWFKLWFLYLIMIFLIFFPLLIFKLNR